MRSPIVWFGGKGKMVRKLLDLMPLHQHYVEPFCGGASLFFAKCPSGGVETLNDLDGGIVGFYRVLRDPEMFARFERLAQFTPYSREEYYAARATWADCADPVERARRWWVVARMSFSGLFGASFGTVVATSRRGMAENTSKFTGVIDRLPEVHARLRQAQVEHVDFRRIIERYNAPGTLCYCDPPYIRSTRRASKQSGEYAHEMDDNDHRDLVSLLLEYPALVMLSGYDHPIYKPLDDAGWTRYVFQTACYAAARTRQTGIQGKGAAMAMQARTEIVWLNPAGKRPEKKPMILSWRAEGLTPRCAVDMDEET